MSASLPEMLCLAAAALLAASGVPGLFTRDGQRAATVLTVLGALAGFGGMAALFAGADSAGLTLPWAVPGGPARVRLDAIGALFAAPVLLMAALGSIYGERYWSQDDHPTTGKKVRLFWGTLTGAMVLIVISRTGLFFLFSWELMAISAFFLVSTEDDRAEVRAAGWLYLILTHVSTLTLWLLFALMRRTSGSWDLAPLAGIGPGLAAVLFFLALFGFGLKAGLMPLHVWLPSAHANAPTHVSALLSGVLIKMGIYGLVRITSLLPHPPASFGALLLLGGIASGILGVAFAIGQHDLKRLLAYHSIENIGIIVMGLGLAMLGRTHGRAEWVVLGLGGALLHVWNHGLFKALLFFSAGSVIHATHTRQIDHLGGLGKRMPSTAALFLLGAVAISGLPPLNGFVSELLVYLGLFDTARDGGFAAAALGAPALAVIGALAVACFVKVYGAVFQGEPRSAVSARESPRPMLAPMGVLGVLCVLIGLWPGLVAPWLDRAVRDWAPAMAAPSLATVAPFGWVSLLGLALVALTGLGAWALRAKAAAAPSAGTWDCGFAAPTPRIQYTASSFAQMLVDLFAWVLRPRTHRPHIAGVHPRGAAFKSHIDDTVLDRAVLPLAHRMERALVRLHFLQSGRAQTYVLYVLLTAVALLLGLLPVRSFLEELFLR